jgi:hypothetical protein
MFPKKVYLKCFFKLYHDESNGFCKDYLLDIKLNLP